MYDISQIYEPATLDEVLASLLNNPEQIIIAGGTDVLIRLHHGKLGGASLVSLRGIEELRGVTLREDGTISIGALTSFTQIMRNEIVKKYIPVLGEAVANIGGPQIRNMATIGGNICNGAVSADSASTLFVYNAILRLVSSEGERRVRIQDFYEGPGKVRLMPGELLHSIEISEENYCGFHGEYIKYSNRKALDIAMLGVAVLCRIKGGSFKELRIALGVAAPTPIRCSEAEEYAAGLTITSSGIKELSVLALHSSKARDSWRASKAYREHLIEVLTERAIISSVIKAGGEIDE
jgi:xanthine dehydrogenase FAD-binding subunit